MERSESFKELATALAKAQGAMHGATKDGTNPAFRSQYATLASVIEAARGPLTENGIAFLQMPGALTADGLPITTTLMHCSGEWVSSTLVMPVQKRDPQGIGSVITYGCRYSLMSLLGLPPVDDDAEAATDRSQDRSPPRPAVRQVPQMPAPEPVEDDPFGLPPIEEPTEDQTKAYDTLREAITGYDNRGLLLAWVGSEQTKGVIAELTGHQQEQLRGVVRRHLDALSYKKAKAA